ncbi:MAG: hypothetical protein KDD66_06260 [Bdellovibrionales bacterium]|nr:hypothetical protein [Bdellovibrionales bacterium]
MILRNAVACCAILALTACFSQGQASNTTPAFSTNGSILISRALPSAQVQQPSMHAFMPQADFYSARGSIILTKSIPELSSSAPVIHPFVPVPELVPAPSSIIITNPVPGLETNEAPGLVFAFIPPAVGFTPAENETWLAIERESKTLTLNRGKTVIKEIHGEGVVDLKEGLYALQHKQKRPLWYAPDSYFKERRMNVPQSGDRQRYRRGALGQYVLYPTTTFPIHSGPLWTRDVGGLRLSRADLSSIYYMLPIGASIVVK